VTLWRRFLGVQKEVSPITRGEMERFCDFRGSGALSPKGDARKKSVEVAGEMRERFNHS
jgi:hypothetical protein